MRPGAGSPGGIGVDIKHNCYERYLNRIKAKQPLRTWSSEPDYDQSSKNLKRPLCQIVMVALIKIPSCFIKWIVKLWNPLPNPASCCRHKICSRRLCLGAQVQASAQASKSPNYFHVCRFRAVCGKIRRLLFHD